MREHERRERMIRLVVAAQWALAIAYIENPTTATYAPSGTHLGSGWRMRSCIEASRLLCAADAVDETLREDRR